MPTVGGTENVIGSRALADGVKTILENAAREPEIVDLANFLVSMRIQMKATVNPLSASRALLHQQGAEYSVMADRIEAGTFMVAAGITGGKLVPEKLPIGEAWRGCGQAESHGGENWQNRRGNGSRCHRQPLLR